MGGGLLRTALPLLTLPLLLILAGCSQAGQDRQADVAERGRQVMPFDLDATTHHWQRTPEGVVQEVVADDPADPAQVELIRRHLAEEAERFSRGDFGDPGAIHGEDMPGLEELRRHGGRLSVAYRDIPAGARLTFTTAEAELVRALHDWADAQTSDHGAHAE